MLVTDILPEWLVGPLPDGDKILSLGDQVKVEGVLLDERLGKILPSLDRGYVKGSEPLERGARQTLLEQTDQEPFVSVELSKISAVDPQMQDGAAATVVLFEFRDAEVQRECGLWEVVEVPKLVGLAIPALHLTKCSLQITDLGKKGV